MTNFPARWKRLNASRNSSPLARARSAEPTRTKTPFTRESRDARSSASTTSMMESLLLPISSSPAEALSAMPLRRSSSSTALPGMPSPRISATLTTMTATNSRKTMTRAMPFSTLFTISHSQFTATISLLRRAFVEPGLSENDAGNQSLAGRQWVLYIPANKFF